MLAPATCILPRVVVLSFLSLLHAMEDSEPVVVSWDDGTLIVGYAGEAPSTVPAADSGNVSTHDAFVDFFETTTNIEAAVEAQEDRQQEDQQQEDQQQFRRHNGVGEGEGEDTPPSGVPEASSAAWWQRELFAAMELAIDLYEHTLAARVRWIEDRERWIEAREAALDARERRVEEREADEEEVSVEEAERLRSAVAALEAAGASSGDFRLTDAAAKLRAEASARAAAHALVQAHHSKANGPPSATRDIKAAELAVRDVVVRMCSSRTQPGNRTIFEANAQEAFGGSLGTEMRAALLLSYHKWHRTAGTHSNSSRRAYRPRRRHRRSHSAPPSTGGGRASGSLHTASGYAEACGGQPEAHDESGEAAEVRRAILQAIDDLREAGRTYDNV